MVKAPGKAQGKHKISPFLQVMKVLGSVLERVDRLDRLDIGTLLPFEVLLHPDISSMVSYHALKSDPYCPFLGWHVGAVEGKNSTSSLLDVHSKLSFSLCISYKALNHKACMASAHCCCEPRTIFREKKRPGIMLRFLPLSFTLFSAACLLACLFIYLFISTG